MTGKCDRQACLIPISLHIIVTQRKYHGPLIRRDHLIDRNPLFNQISCFCNRLRILAAVEYRFRNSRGIQALIRVHSVGHDTGLIGPHLLKIKSRLVKEASSVIQRIKIHVFHHVRFQRILRIVNRVKTVVVVRKTEYSQLFL